MSGQKDFSVAALQLTLDELPAKFTLDEVIFRLAFGKSKALRDRVARLLDGYSELFDDGEGNYFKRADFFKGFEILVTPDEWEISNGVLFPGHRFAAVVSPEIFPSEVKLRLKNLPDPIAMREITAPLGQIFGYHTLLGSEQVFDFMIAEHPANARLSESARRGDPVTLNVFDMGAIYRVTKFETGDALRCRVTDYEKGELEISYLSGDRRSSRELRDWVAAFDGALEKVTARFGEYLDLAEEIAWCYYYGGDMVRKPLASLDEYLHESCRAEIRADGDHALLTLRSAAVEAAEDVPGDVPEGFGISNGATDSLGELLKEVGTALTPVEIDSYILDQCFGRSLEFDDFFSRTFPRELKFADDGQEAVFLNYLEERFEELTGNYNRADDEIKAPLRTQILELVGDRLDFFDFLAGRDAAMSDEVHHLVHHLAGGALQLDEILRSLNDPAFTPSDSELDKLGEIVDRRAGDQDELIEKCQAILEGRA